MLSACVSQMIVKALCLMRPGKSSEHLTRSSVAASVLEWSVSRWHLPWVPPLSDLQCFGVKPFVPPASLCCWGTWTCPFCWCCCLPAVGDCWEQRLTAAATAVGFKCCLASGSMSAFCVTHNSGTSIKKHPSHSVSGNPVWVWHLWHAGGQPACVIQLSCSFTRVHRLGSGPYSSACQHQRTGSHSNYAASRCLLWVNRKHLQ